MDNLAPFCTCRDTACPCHPTNHARGCSPCIQKNLREGEIPSCFFNKVGGVEGLASFYYRDFAEAVLRAEAGREGSDPEK